MCLPLNAVYQPNRFRVAIIMLAADQRNGFYACCAQYLTDCLKRADMPGTYQLCECLANGLDAGMAVMQAADMQAFTASRSLKLT